MPSLQMTFWIVAGKLSQEEADELSDRFQTEIPDFHQNGYSLGTWAPAYGESFITVQVLPPKIMPGPYFSTPDGIKKYLLELETVSTQFSKNGCIVFPTGGVHIYPVFHMELLERDANEPLTWCIFGSKGLFQSSDEVLSSKVSTPPLWVKIFDKFELTRAPLFYSADVPHGSTVFHPTSALEDGKVYKLRMFSYNAAILRGDSWSVAVKHK